MPDIATTVILIENAEAEAAVRELLNADGQLDFNKIIPQPENIFNGSLSQQDIDRCAAAGIPTWREWNPKNWGTKWNAFNTVIERGYDGTSALAFDTAWCKPLPVIDQMMKMIPGLRRVR